jgi:hemerythrin-like domain-containing protein
MLRDKNLIPLSHQHQRALALCVRIDRASPIAEADLGAWQSEIAQLFQSEIGAHFAAEEQIVFPAAAKFDELKALVEELISEHADLRAQFARAGARDVSSKDVAALAQRLSAHIRKEERRLFESMQKLLSREELALLGDKLELALKNATGTCVLPSAATRLRPAK